MPVDTYPAPVQSTPGAVLGYAEAPATSQGSITTEVDVTGLAVTISVPAGRRIRISARGQYQNAAGAGVLINIKEGATLVNSSTNIPYSNIIVAWAAEAIITPTAGVHTYKVTAQNYGGGTVTLQAGGTYGVSFIIVEDITGGTGGPGPINLAYMQVAGGIPTLASATETDVAGTEGSLSVTVNVPAGRRLRISAFAGIASTVAGDAARVAIKEGATYLSDGGAHLSVAGAIAEVRPEIIVTPTAGTHTYKLTWRRQSGTGTMTMYGAGTIPAWLAVDDITGTPSPAGILPTSQTLAFTPVTTPANQTYTNTEVDLTGFTATFTVPDGRRVRISYGVYPQSSVTDDNIIVKTYLDGVAIDEDRMTFALANNPERMEHANILTPSAGTHTIKLTSWRISGTGTITQNNGAAWPCWLLVEDITGGAPALPATSVPVGQLGYGLSTISGNAVYTVETTVPGCSVNVTVPAGRTLRITAHLWTTWSLTGSVSQHRIREDGTDIGTLGNFTNNTGHGFSAYGIVVRSPAAGAHTYTLVAQPNATAGSVTVYNAATTPTYILVEDITPTPAPANTAPSSTLGYAEVLTSQTIGAVSTETDIIGASVTVTVPAGRRLKISAQTLLNTNVANDEARMHIKEGATWLQTVIHSFSGALWETFRGEVIISPSAGTHTYFLRANRQSGTGSLATYAAAALPTFILVEDISSVALPSQIVPGVLVVSSTSRPGNPLIGTMIFETDTNNLAIWLGSVWQTINMGAWTAFTPVWTAAGTAPNIGNGVLAGRYVRIGRTIMGTMRFAPGSTTTFGTSDWKFSLPVAPSFATSNWATLGVAKAYAGGNSLNGLVRLYSGQSNLHVVYPATWPGGTETPVNSVSPWTWVNGNDMDLNFMYEAAS